MVAISLESPETHSLPSMLAQPLQDALKRLSRVEAVRAQANRALRALANFVSKFQLRYKDLEIQIDYPLEPGLADIGYLDDDLLTLVSEAGLAARQAKSALVLFIDELQYLDHPQTSALLYTLHRCGQDRLPVVLVGAGLPGVPQQFWDARSYASRMFTHIEIGTLEHDEAMRAIIQPAETCGVTFEADAACRIVDASRGYPYFLNQWASQAWYASDGKQITLSDVEGIASATINLLDRQFFAPQLRRLSHMERRCLLELLAVDQMPRNANTLTRILGYPDIIEFEKLADGLVAKGLVSEHVFHELRFALPLLDEFLKRAIPKPDPAMLETAVN